MGLHRLLPSSKEQGTALRWRLLGYRAQALSAWRTCLVAPWLVGSSRIRDQTHVSSTGRQILYHWATKGRFLCIGSWGGLIYKCVVFWSFGETVGWHHQLNGHEFEQTLGDSKGQESLACCSPWGHKESDTTEWLNYDNKYVYLNAINFPLLILFNSFRYIYKGTYIFIYSSVNGH